MLQHSVAIKTRNLVIRPISIASQNRQLNAAFPDKDYSLLDVLYALATHDNPALEAWAISKGYKWATIAYTRLVKENISLAAYPAIISKDGYTIYLIPCKGKAIQPV
jgi:hypothetical protein